MPKKEVKTSVLHLGFIHAHQRKSTCPAAEGRLPSMIRQLVRTERSLFSTAFTLFDHWLLLIWHCPLSSNDFPLIDPTSHLSQRIKGVKLRPDRAYGPCDVLPTECALAPTISNSVSFVLIGTGLGRQRAERIMQLLWTQAFWNADLSS